MKTSAIILALKLGFCTILALFISTSQAVKLHEKHRQVDLMQLSDPKPQCNGTNGKSCADCATADCRWGPGEPVNGKMPKDTSPSLAQANPVCRKDGKQCGATDSTVACGLNECRWGKEGPGPRDPDYTQHMTRFPITDTVASMTPTEQRQMDPAGIWKVGGASRSLAQKAADPVCNATGK